MKTYDWIVVGGGITGAVLAYELATKGLRVLIIEKDPRLSGATRYSYGGIAYLSGTSELTRLLCQEGIECHRQLSEELEADTQFRELDLIMTIPADEDPQKAVTNYAQFTIKPKLISVKDACDLEPLLNPDGMAGALIIPHAHIHPGYTTQAYHQAFLRAGGEFAIGKVVEILQKGNFIQGVKTINKTYYAANTVICAGGLSRALFQASGISIPLYFTNDEMIETPPVNLKLRTIVMTANLQRFQLEKQATTHEFDSLWDEPDYEIVPPILDPGAIQFLDGSLRMGQISRIITNPYAKIDPVASENYMRQEIGKVLPALEHIPGTWHHCLVAFSNNGLPIIRAINDVAGCYIFSGFTNPWVLVPPLAKRFANWVTGEEDNIIPQLLKT